MKMEECSSDVALPKQPTIYELDEDPNYLIYDTGRVFSKKSDKYLKPTLINGYLIVTIHGKNVSIQRLVGKYHVENPDPEKKIYVNHLDENKENNKKENLEWVTASENTLYSIPSRKEARVKEVLQLDENNNLIKEFRSISEAERVTGVSYYMITTSCNSDFKKMSLDKQGTRCYWRFKEQIREEDLKDGKTLPFFPANYLFLKSGKIYSKRNKCYLKPSETRGYLTVSIHLDLRTKKTFYVHILIALAFLPLPPNDIKNLRVDHINDTRNDNRAENLQWLSNQGNIIKAVKTGGLAKLRKPVLMIDKTTGNVIKEFESVREAGRQMKTSSSGISAVCLGKQKTAAGYIWKHKERETDELVSSDEETED